MLSKLLYIVFPIFLFNSCRAQSGEKLQTSTDGNTLLWEVSGNNLELPSYLFGTFHLMCKEDISFSKSLKQAVQNSQEVYFEMDLDDPSNTLGAILFMNMKDGKTLKGLYTPEEYKRLEIFFQDSLRTSLGMFSRMKPNFLEALLFPKMMPCKTMSGIEDQLMKLSKEQKKEINGFETIAVQAAVFDSVPYETQARGLLNTIDSLDFYRKYFDTLLVVYKSQRLIDIEKMLNEPGFGMDDNRDMLLDNRNMNWVTQLQTILPKKNIFIAVGAGHLVGKKGLIELLRQKGYTLRPLMNRD